jgi:hypothetical protein
MLGAPKMTNICYFQEGKEILRIEGKTNWYTGLQNMLRGTQFLSRKKGDIFLIIRG